GSGRSDESRRSRTASRTGGTCTSPGRRRRACTGTGRPRRSRRSSRARLPEDPLHAPLQPLRLAACGLGERLADEEHVVGAGRDLRQELTPHLAEAALDPVAHDRPTDLLRDGDPEPNVTLTLCLAVPVEAIEHEEARRHRATLPVDGIEVARTRQAVAALHRDRTGVPRYADRRLRPRARRRCRIARPARVDIRARKPWRRFRRRTLG